MRTHLFTYGTLQISSIFQRVAGHLFTAQNAVLDGYMCCCVRGEVYPGIKPFYGAQTSGKLYLHVTLPALKRLDFFEGDFYKRIQTRVRLTNGTMVNAHVYCIQKKYRPVLSTQPWHIADFTNQKQTHFLTAYPFMPVHHTKGLPNV
ncbi:MAG: gamma-glutamylcyclotransferase family protein [Candidatus Latescibacterota bacterium]|jgi:gamma-glutamylcyclotransferase (GGCT)/AIG2-like uncharacterized protein YtfP